MYNIYLLENFNNYYNRRIIRYETIKEYWTHQTNNNKSYKEFTANFIPNDGVSTEHIVNAQQLDIDWNPDYLILVSAGIIVQRWFVIDSVRTTMGQYRLSLKRDTVADYFNEAISAPCFIEKATIPYKNPLIYNKENFSVNQIKTSEHFLKDPTESAWIVGYLSNNFKTEDVFKPGTDVIDNDGYRTIKNVRGTNISSEVPSDYEPTADIKTSIRKLFGIPNTVDPFDCIGYNPKKFLRARNNANTEGKVGYVYRNSIFYTLYAEEANGALKANNATYAFCFNGNGDPTTVGLTSKLGTTTKIVDGLYKGDLLNLGWQVKEDKATEFSYVLRGQINPITPVYNYSSFNQKLPNMISEIMNVNGITNFVEFGADIPSTDVNESFKFYESKNRTLYTVTLREKIKAIQTVYNGNTIAGIVETNIAGGEIVDTIYSKYQNNYFDKNNLGKWPEPKNGVFKVLIHLPIYYLEVSTEFVKPVYGYDFPDTVNTLSDNPYKMFCIPYNSVTLGGYKTWGDGIKTDPNICFETAIDLSRRLTGSNYLSDLQILPYCPCLEYFTENENGKYFDVGENSNLGKNVQYSFIYEGYVENAEIKLKDKLNKGDEPIGIILFPEKSSMSFTVDAPSEITTRNLINEFEDNPIEAKVKNQCDLYRLCSPNYASAFDFNVVKNKGVDFFRINMTCKPYNPFIQIVPNFKELYGSDFNDNRGLILGGDFSLPQINDAWETYQLNNKTYEASFNRSIENMEKTHRYDMVGNIAGAAGGIAAGAAAGAIAGSVVPGVGTVVGAVVGGALSAVGGAADVALSQYRFNETRDLAKDQFGFALQNIQALSQTLSRTSSLTINHKLFPFLEYYTCTDEEKEALRSKIKWNGMTIGVISNNGIKDYILDEESYIKGSIINIEIPDDAHIAQDISREIYEGVRLKNEYTV